MPLFLRCRLLSKSHYSIPNCFRGLKVSQEGFGTFLDLAYFLQERRRELIKRESWVQKREQIGITWKGNVNPHQMIFVDLQSQTDKMKAVSRKFQTSGCGFLRFSWSLFARMSFGHAARFNIHHGEWVKASLPRESLKETRLAVTSVSKVPTKIQDMWNQFHLTVCEVFLVAHTQYVSTSKLLVLCALFQSASMTRPMCKVFLNNNAVEVIDPKTPK